MNTENKLAIIGLGYVGLPLALLAERKGYEVIGIDIDEKKITQLKSGHSPFFDDEVEKKLSSAKNIVFTTDFSEVKKATFIAICVPTPVYENHMPNLGPVIGASEGIAKHLQRGQVIILESTVNPGVSESIVLPILEKESGLVCGKDFYLAHCPERINPGDPKWNVENINRVIGSFDNIGLEKAATFYEKIITGTIKRMGSLKEAEAVKVVENSFRDINIAFVNELARSFSCLGIDVVNVIDGAATKPFSFMAHYPGCGVGGHCIPVDPYYLIEYAKAKGFFHDFLSLARRINNDMPQFSAELVMKGLNDVNISMKGTKVAVLGLSYKADIDDCRESPSFEIIKELKKYGANVVAYDPFVLKRSDVKTLDEAIDGAKAVFVATSHVIFKNLEPEYLLKNGVKVVVDGRNCLLKEKFIEAGLIYEGIGR
jgi:nucleotide sugar dehydrogenase